MAADGSGGKKESASSGGGNTAAIIGAVGVVLAAAVAGLFAVLARSGGGGLNPPSGQSASSSSTVLENSPSPSALPSTSAASCGSPVSGASGPLVFCDNFGSKQYAWSDLNNPGSADASYVTGGYSVSAAAGGDTEVGVPTDAPLGIGNTSPLDIVLTTSADPNSDSGGQYGLICRGGPSPAQGLQGKSYAFAIQGTAAVIEKFEFKDGKTHVKQLVYSGPQPAIHQGPNVLQASCSTASGNAVQLAFWVNSTEVLRYSDKTTPFFSGYVGVFTYTAAGSTAGITAKFSSFSAYHS
jgi:hypothetical protein